jgi:hypothetical protein
VEGRSRYGAYRHFAVLWIRNYFFRIRMRGSVILTSGSRKLIIYGSIRILPGHFCGQPMKNIMLSNTGGKSLNHKILDFFFLKCLQTYVRIRNLIRIRNSEFMDPDPGGQLIRYRSTRSGSTTLVFCYIFFRLLTTGTLHLRYTGCRVQ